MHLSPPFITMSGWRDGKELLRLTKLRCNFFLQMQRLKLQAWQAWQ